MSRPKKASSGLRRSLRAGKPARVLAFEPGRARRIARRQQQSNVACAVDDLTKRIKEKNPKSMDALFAVADGWRYDYTGRCYDESRNAGLNSSVVRAMRVELSQTLFSPHTEQGLIQALKQKIAEMEAAMHERRKVQ